ncbi:MAG: acyl-CoA dehydrogenase family protein [Dethiobacteria bacterium]|jgi:butyryl-CoA dehydrogenase|nr:acyl-CoA dehydrogenase family protein [Bacillota bacterium]HPZ65244.1 acyl-CoA dehydrogenase family protein [Bacillota bacterium]HQD06610.1 acyl-CoA dehydrogenase family protein [Bacillota bacterium]
MSYFLTEEQELFRKTVREFVDKEVRPRAAEIDETDEFPMDLWKRCAELGLTGISYPEEYGGLGADMVTELMVMEEIGKACPTLALILDVNLYTIGEILGLGTTEQKEKFVPDLASGRRIGGIASTQSQGSSNMAEWGIGAQLEGDHYVVNVTKVFQTNSLHSGTIVLSVMSEEGLIKLIVDKANTPGIETGHIERKMGLKGSDTGTIVFNNVKVPVENKLESLPFGKYSTVPFMDIGAICLGIAEEAYEKTKNYLLQRTKSFRPLASFNNISIDLAKIAADIELARSLIYTAGRLFDTRGEAGYLPFICKAWTSEMAVRNVSRCIEFYGNVGYSEETGLTRLLRDVQGLCIAEGSTGLLYAVMANMAGLPAALA